MTAAERAYYDRRAPEYDDWYHGTGFYASRLRPRWHEEVAAIREVVRSVDAASVLDVACGTGFLTQCLRPPVTALDQSARMLEIARTRLPGRPVIRGDALRLPFRDATFGLLFAGHLYGHLGEADRERFLSEAHRVAPRILVIDAALRDDVQPEERQERTLSDGSKHTVFKRYFTPAQLAAELGGGAKVFAGRWFVAVLSGPRVLA